VVDQVNPEGTGDQGQQSLGWRAALPDEFKEHEFVKTFQKPGDFVKSAIEIKTERDALNKKLENVIPKLSPDATQEQKDAFYASLGRPEKADGYEFEGTIDEATANWAKATFYQAGLTKDQARVVQTQWNGFMEKMVKAETDSREKERTAAESALKTELGDKYDASVEMVRRFWKKHSNEDFDKFVNETKIGNDPRMIRFLVNVAKVTGEDSSPPGSPQRSSKTPAGLVYDKSPAPPA
jgi:hypothetical protein